MKRAISLLLAVVLLIGMVPTTVWASETTAADDHIERKVIILSEDTAEVVAEETSVTETTLETAETTAPVTEATEVTVETTEAATEPTLATEAPTEETVPEETAAETVPSQEDTEDAPVLGSDSVSANGICGDGLTWTLENGTLTISGTGAMADYVFNSNDSPWTEYSDAITAVIINNGVASIGDYAFFGCHYLTSADIPASVTSIGKSAFGSCSRLTDIAIPDSVTSIGDYVFSSCQKLESVTLSKNITSIGIGVFYACYKLSSIVIPDGVTTIGQEAFSHCEALTSVTIPSSVTVIEDEGFYDCESLEAVYINDLAAWCGISFNGYGSNPLSYAQNLYLNGELLTQCVIPEGVTSIPDNTFKGCRSLTSVTIPDSVVSIGESAFQYCKNITSVVIGNGVTTIDNHAFYHCESLTDLVLPNSLTTLKQSAFESCTSLAEVVLPDGVTTIEHYVFAGCSSLTSVTIPPSVTDVSNHAFYECENLSDVYIRDLSAWCNIDFYEYGNPLWYADSLYVNGELLMDCVIPEGVTKIGAYCFKNYSYLLSVTIPDSVTSIGDHAFSGCSRLGKITIPDSVTSIGDSAFSDCSGLKRVSIGDRVTTIGQYAFAKCVALAGITLPGNVTSLGTGAFYSCSNLVGIALPKSITTIGRYAFSGCTALCDVYYAGTEAEWSKVTVYGSNEVLTNATFHYNSTGPNWGNISVETDHEEQQKTAEKKIIIKAASAEKSVVDAVVDAIVEFFSGPEIFIYSALGTDSVSKNGYVIDQSDAVKQDIILRKEEYRDYILPVEVAASFMEEPSDNDELGLCISYEHTAYMQKDRKDGKPYISTVFGMATGNTAAYQELRYEELKMYEDSLFDIIVTAVGMEGKDPTYYISQYRIYQDENDSDGDRSVSSKTGIFSAVDLYNEFEYGKEVYAYAIAADGTATEPIKLRITKMAGKNEKVEAFLKSTTFSLIGKNGQAIQIPDDFPLVGGGKISLEAFQSPIGIDINGSDIKFSFGVDIFSSKTGSQLSEKEKTNIFKNFKKFFDTDYDDSDKTNLQKAKEELEFFRKIKEKYKSGNGSGKYSNSSKNFDLEFLGYAECTYINGKLCFKDIYLKVKGQFTFRYTQQTAVWVVPAYFYVEAGIGVGLATRWARFLGDKEIPLDFGFILEIEPSLKLGGGAGVKNAVSAGIWGKGTLPYMNDFTEQHHILKLIGEFGAEAEFFILKGDVTLLSGELLLIDEYYGSKKTYSLRAPTLQSAGGTSNAATVVSRDYSEDTSSWLGEQAYITPYAVAASGVSFRDLQTSVFDRSQPQVAVYGGGLIMVWVEDDASRDTYNRMRLMYSLYNSDADTWSEAQPVSDDGHNDAYPSLVSDGTNVYVAWQKIDKTLTEEDCKSIDALLESSEVMLAKFDSASGKFGKAEKLTDNDLYEYAPTAVIEGNAPAVYYASAAGRDLSSTGKHTLYRQTMGGTAETVAGYRNYILGIDAAGGEVSYVMDMDGDTSTTNDINVYTISNGSSTVFDKGDNNVGYTYAAYADFNGEPTLFVSDMSNIYYMENGECKYVFESDRSIAGNLNIAQSAAGTAILWTETEDGWNELYAVSYEDGAWTEPVRISQQGEMLSAIDIAALNGKLVGVCNATAMSYDYSSGSYNKGTTDLSFFKVNDFTDISVSDYIYFDETTAQPGRDQTFDVILTNKGTTTVQSVEFTITDTLGTSHTVTETVNLTSGSTGSVTLTYPVPANYSATTLEITASTLGSRDIDTDNNTVSIAIGKPDLSVMETAVHTFDDGYIIKAAVENGSAVNANNVILSVMLDDEENEPIHTQEIGTLDRYTYASVDVALAKDKLTFDENGVARVCLRAESDGEEAADADNVTYVLITQQVDICTHSATETVIRQEPTCTTDGHTAYERCTSCGKTVSAYEELPATGHSWNAATCTDPKTCSICGATEGSVLGHDYVDGICTRCGDDVNAPETTNVTRISGKGRLQTAFKTADKLKEVLNVAKFDTILIASGNSFADALAGSYLAAVKNAPILLSWGGDADNLDYIQENLSKEDGIVYILGGTAAVPQSMEDLLSANNIHYERIKGKTRLDTNIEILKKAGINGDEILVATGWNFADSLSASATGKPILLVNNTRGTLTDAQKEFLSGLGEKKFTIIGGSGAVSEDLATELSNYGTVKRLSGKTREVTSVLVAKSYFNAPDTALLAYSRNFPDGLCGGPLAYAMKAPLLLVNTNQESAAADYVAENAIKTGYIMGGSAAVSDESVQAVFGVSP